MSSKTALIIGANSYIGEAVASAFARANYRTFGVIRTAKHAANLQEQGVTPIIGSAADKEALTAAISEATEHLDVVVTTTEQWPDYMTHFNDTVALLRELAARYSSSASAVDGSKRFLVIFTSGTKDYGRGKLAGDDGLVAHTEYTPMNPLEMLRPRTESAERFLQENGAFFDALVVRPSNVHGRSSSYYGLFFELGQRAEKSGGKLVFPGDPRVITDSIHVDDAAEGYVALATHHCQLRAAGKKSNLPGEAFNISATPGTASGRQYETLGQVSSQLESSFNLAHPIEFVTPRSEEVTDMTGALFQWSQWIGSEKIRNLTGWKAKRPMFGEGFERYKIEYEQAVAGNDENVTRMLTKFGAEIDGLVHT